MPSPFLRRRSKAVLIQEFNPIAHSPGRSHKVENVLLDEVDVVERCFEFISRSPHVVLIRVTFPLADELNIQGR
jgi:hypothetical protein